jgi:hypothetical protein
MKRTPLRKVSPNKVKKPKKVSKLNKVGKQPISKIQRMLWEECKRIIRTRYKNVCYTCGRTGLEGSNWHTGHMFAKASLSAYLKYDLRLLRPQCYFCNVNCGGQGAHFIENMRRIEGDEYVNQILKDRQITIKAYDHYVELLNRYKLIEK